VRGAAERLAASSNLIALDAVALWPPLPRPGKILALYAHLGGQPSLSAYGAAFLV
jgi:hypothetical protein